MFKSVFTRYIVSFMLIFVLSFICFGAIIYRYVYEYARDEMKSSVQTAAYSSKRTLDVLYTEYLKHKASGGEEITGEEDLYKTFYEEDKGTIFTVLEGVAKFSDEGILLVDKDGNVMIATDRNQEGKTVPEGYFFIGDSGEPEYASEEKILIDGLFEKKVFVCAMILSGKDNDAYVLTYNLADKDVEMLRRLLQGISVSAIIVFLLGFAACYLVSFGIVKPLREMSRAAKRFALGDFSARVVVRGQDEIADLCKSFNGMAKDLGDLDKQRSSFLANVSHDLRTPMTSISGFVDGILDGTIKEEEREHYLNIISVEVKRLSRLVRTLLEVSRIEAGERKFNMVDFDVKEMTMMILFSFEKQIDEKYLDVEIDCEDDDCYVKADSDAIHQVLYNLIDNAVKFSYEKGKLRVSIRRAEKSFAIEIFNEGKGIAEEDLPHIFDRFYKADKSRGLDKSGVGLGLFIVKAIVQAHGENITATSREGKDCSFLLHLPVGEKPSPEMRKMMNR